MVEYEIELPVVAIFRIMQLINDKCKGSHTSRDYKVACDLYEKIEITDEERERKYQFKDKQGEDRINAVALRDAPNKRVILDFREMEKLEKLLDDCSDFSPAERRLWLNYVLAQLEQARKPTLDDEETKTRRLADIGKNSSERVSTP